jgi:adenylate cyclase
MALGVVSASWQLLDRPGYWISPLAVEMVLILNAAVLGFLEYGLSRRELWIRNQQLLKSQDATISSLTALAETRDTETGGHIRRTREYVRLLAQGLAKNPKYRQSLDPETIELLYKTAPLHDIGKVGIADGILLKPGLLTDEERKEMERHTLLGAEALAVAEEQSFGEGDRNFLSLAREITIAHHEKWDGSGYPQGLCGEQIPLGGRLMALADVYDALISKRVYKDPMPHEKAVQIIVEGRGTHFDPNVVDVFLENQERFREISARYA